MKIRTPQHAQEARPAAEAPGADLASVRKAASVSMDVSRPVGVEPSGAEDLLAEFVPCLRGAAKPIASGAPGVKNYGEPWKDILADYLTTLNVPAGPGNFTSIEAMLGHYDHNKCAHGDSLGVRWFLENRKEILGVLRVAALVEFSPAWETALTQAMDHEVVPPTPEVLGEDL